MTVEARNEDEYWSEIRQAFLPRFEARLYLERAGLKPSEAVKWWEQFIFSAEAREAIEAGRTIEEETARIARTEPLRREERRSDGMTRLHARRAVEVERARTGREDAARHRGERDRLAADRNFLEGLSPTTSDLVRRVTAVGLDAGTDYPDSVQVESAVNGRMMCVRYELDDMGYLTGKRTEFDATFGEVLHHAVDSTTGMIDIHGLSDGEDVQLLSSVEFWPTTVRLIELLEGEPLYLNGRAYGQSVEGLVLQSDED